ncbi:MAG: GNAT family N-acetyltransferase [Anaerolineales bacterium]|nr:GNAT family N-acetyltransferase [Anaerolineales bacterium]
MPHTRPYNPAHDFEKMWRFLQQDYTQKQDNYVWHFSRLGDWQYGLWNEKKLIPSFFRKYAQVWVDAFDDIVGCVLSEDGDNIFFIFTRAGYEYLYPEILDWTLITWGERYPTLKTEVHEFQTDALEGLARAGFRSRGVVATTRAYDLQKPLEPAHLPPGSRIETMDANGDFYGKGLLYKDGFSNQDFVTELDLLKFEYSRENPAYDPAFDFVVIAPDGTHAATCAGFNDPSQRVSEVEKICTHRQYRRQGLAEAAVRACFQKLQQRGIARAYITGYSGEANGLYEKLGPCGYKQWFHYEREGK